MKVRAWDGACGGERGGVGGYRAGAVSSRAARPAASHAFSPWTLKNAEQPAGGGSLDAIYGGGRSRQAGYTHIHTLTHTHTHTPESSYLLEGVHCGGVGSQGEGKLQHVDLDGAEHSGGSLHNKLVVGLFRICSQGETAILDQPRLSPKEW